MATLARSDVSRAARYIRALLRGGDENEEMAGAYLVADAMISLRGLEDAQVEWKAGRPGV